MAWRMTQVRSARAPLVRRDDQRPTVGARRLVPRGRDAHRAHARRLGGDVLASRRRTAAELPELRDHIERRLARAPRYRQKLASVPLGLHAPEWIDDPAFSVDRHVYWAPGPLDGLVDEVMSTPLRRDRPLWEMWICEDTANRRWRSSARPITAWSTASPRSSSPRCCSTPHPSLRAARRTGGAPSRSPAGSAAAGAGGARPPRRAARLLRWPLRAASVASARRARSPAALARDTRARALAARAAPASVAQRPALTAAPPRVGRSARSRICADQARLRHDRQRCDARRRRRRGPHVPAASRRAAVALKAMVPVSVRSPGRARQPHLVCVRRAALRRARPAGPPAAGARHDEPRKRDGEPEGADLALKAAARRPAPCSTRCLASIASPRTFNLVVSNIPGPPEPMYMLGCPLRGGLSGGAAGRPPRLSVGMTSVRDRPASDLRRPRGAARRDELAERHRRGDHELLAGVRPERTTPVAQLTHVDDPR